MKDSHNFIIAYKYFHIDRVIVQKTGIKSACHFVFKISEIDEIKINLPNFIKFTLKLIN